MDSSTKQHNKRPYYIFSTICLFILITITFTHCILSITWRHRLRNELQSIRKKGMPMSCADLAGPKIPDAENGAVVYNKAFKLLPHSSAKSDLDTIEGLLFRNWQKLEESDWDTLHQIVKRTKDIVPLIEQAQECSKCRFPVDWSKGLESDPAHLKLLRRLQKHLVTKAAVHAHNGQVAPALHEIGLAFKISDSLENEPAIISQIARVSMIKGASRGLDWVLSESIPSFEQSRELDKILSSITFADEFPKAFADERVMFISLMERAYRIKPDPAMKRMPKPVQDFGSRWMTVKLMPLRYHDQLSFLEFTDKQIRAASVPYRIAKQKHLFAEEKDVSKLAITSRLIAPVYEQIGATRDIPEAYLSGSRICLALHAYKHKFGSFPASLNDLESTFGWKAPKDPFSGKDFIYKLKGKGFILYSIGGDLKDSGGKQAVKPDGPGDIVWSLEP